jgi:hypothetical protein
VRRARSRTSFGFDAPAPVARHHVDVAFGHAPLFPSRTCGETTDGKTSVRCGSASRPQQAQAPARVVRAPPSGRSTGGSM